MMKKPLGDVNWTGRVKEKEELMVEEPEVKKVNKKLKGGD